MSDGDDDLDQEAFIEKMDSMPWPRGATRFDQLTDMVIRWLRGEFEWLPTHSGEPEPGTARSAPALMRMNELGLLTADSQAGEGFGGARERAYVCGVVHMDIAHEIELPLNDMSVVCMIGTMLDKAPSEAVMASRSRTLVTVDGGKAHTRLSGAYDVDYTLGLRQMPIARSLRSEILDDYAYVEIFDPVWGRLAYGANGLDRRILEALERARYRISTR